MPFSAGSAGGMFGFFFRATAPSCFAEAQEADASAFNTFFRSLLDAGTYLAPSPFEAGFLSLSHTEGDIRATLKAASTAMQQIGGAV